MGNLSKTFGKLTILLLVLLAISFSALPARGQYGGGSGTAEDPYQIWTAAQMNAIGADSNDWDMHFILMADIDLSGFDGQDGRPVFNMIAPDKDSSTWQFDGVPFAGVFDGNGHTISNFSYTSTGINYLGLFGHVDGPTAEIKNLGLIDPDVDAGNEYYIGSLVGLIWKGTVTACYVEGGSVAGSNFVGGLVGKNGRWRGTVGTITNCYSTASVSGDWYVGGLVGDNVGTITNCYSSGSVSGDWYVGGLVGDNTGTLTNCCSTSSVSGNSCIGGLVGYSNGTITNCCSTGSVTGGNSVGGLVGSNYHGTITNSYSTAGASGNECVGSLVGYNYGTISNCYSESTVSGDEYVGGLVGWNYYGTITNCYSTGTVAGTSYVGGLVGYSGDWSHCSDSFWDTDTQTHGVTESFGFNGGTITNVSGLTTAQMQTKSTFADAGWDFNTPVWTIDEGVDYPRLWWEKKYGGGTGEPNDPYLIYDANQMNAIGADSNDWDRHFKLMADIDLAGFTGTAFNIIGTDWENPFTGVFDGSGHTISNFSYTSTNTNYIGLFAYVMGEVKDLGLIAPDVDTGTGNYVGSLVGYLKDGTITDCYVQGGNVSGNSSVGGLLGYNYEGTIINCYSTGSVSGTEGSVGGLVGLNYGAITNSYSSSDVSGTSHDVGGLVGSTYYGTITNCYSTGSVIGNIYVGGLVGFSYWGTIANSYSIGDVSGRDRVGGLVGENEKGIITNSYSTSDASGRDRVGGLVGLNYGAITNCYSTGSVSGENKVGGLVGYNQGGTAFSSLWDIQTSGRTISAGGTGLPTAEMQMMSTFTDAGWDFTTPIWTIDEGVDYPRLWWEMVPVLHAEPDVTLGTRNTITWEPVVGGIEYYAECAEDANFTSIVYNSGWITETTYEFTDLELGQRYWYSVKARNIAGTETGWSNVESSLQLTLADAVEIMLEPDTLKKKNLKNTLLNKINTVLEMIDDGFYADVLNKLENDILAKMNGCAETGEPDKNDWIITCEGQSVVYPLVIEAIEYVRGLME